MQAMGPYFYENFLYCLFRILIGLHPSPRKTAQFLITGREQVIKSLFLPIFQIPNEYLFIVFVQIFVFHVYPFIRA